MSSAMDRSPRSFGADTDAGNGTRARVRTRACARARRIGIFAACVGIGWAVLGGTIPAAAESIFAREGIGEWNEGYDLRGYTLGSTGIGTLDPVNFTSINPAASAFAVGTLGHAGIASRVRWSQDGASTARRGATLLNNLGCYLELRKNLGLRVIVEPAADATYALEQSLPTGWEDIERDVVREEGARGLTRYLGGISWRGGRTWALGAQIGVLAGSIVDHTSYVFGDSALAAGWTGGEDRRQWRFKASTYVDAGFVARPTSRISVGGFFSTGASPQVTETYRSFADQSFTLQTARAELPMAFGAGAGMLVTPRWRLSADVIQRQWEDFRFDDRLPAGGSYRNTLRWGAGIERVPSFNRGDGLLAAISWRAGFAWIPWYLHDADGDPIDEWRVTAGAGLPIQQQRGTIDLLVGYGRKGSIDQVGIEEEYLTFGLGFTFARVLREY
ncbi:MAG: hypothetical protein V1774_00355 [Candidatus Eisenbacteria bacterium]